MQTQTTQTEINSIKNLSLHRNSFQQAEQYNLDELLVRIAARAGKKSFLVFKNNKYFNILTENIAFFHIKYD